MAETTIITDFIEGQPINIRIVEHSQTFETDFGSHGLSGTSGISGTSGYSGFSGYDPSQFPLDHDWILGNYSLISTTSGTVTRNLDGFISSITTPTRTLIFTRDEDGYISSITDGTHTWTFTRNISHQIISWSVT